MPSKKTPLGAASAVAKSLQERRQRDDEEEAPRSGGRRVRGGRGGQQAPLIADDVVARLAEQAADQQRVLLSRLVGHGATTKPRNVAASTAVDLSKEKVVEGKRSHGERRACDAPITIDEFDQKYAKDDPMLRYLINVIRLGKSVVRVDIPRRPEGVDGVRRMAVPEEDVLFLAYHRSPPCGFRNVYWLEFILETRAVDGEVEYFALSHHGLTHFRGSSVIDFVDIESWIVEKRAFDYMTAMRGLQKLQGLLFFMSWKKKAIRLKHRRVRARIASSLFQCDPAAAQLLVRIQEHCVRIEECVDTQHLAPATAFTIDHIEQCNRRRIKLVRGSVHGEASKVCQLIESEIAVLKRQRQLEVEAEKQNYANVSRSSRLLDRLYVFLRLVDFHLFESVSTHLNEFVENIHAQVCGGAVHSSQQTEPTDSEGGVVKVQSIKSGMSGVSSDKSTAIDYTFIFSLRHRVVPTPFIYGLLREDVKPGELAAGVRMEVSPTRGNAFDLVYGLLSGYVSCMDSVPRVLSDKRFHGVMAPYTPQNREAFLASLLQPSMQILQNQAKKLKEMKYAIDTYYKQLELQVSDRLRLVGDVYTTEERERHQKDSNEIIDGLSTTLLTAAQYEAARSEWAAVLAEIQGTPRVIQVGILLLDQTALLIKLEDFVGKHMHEMLEELPYVYKQFLCDLLLDVDGRIERVTRIPTSIPDAQKWLKEMMEMMPSHTFRKAFDLKCNNLSRLKQLLKDNGVSWRSSEDQDFVKKKDFEWESIYETLIICLARVQERDSEHRRSVLELSTKADEYITARVDEVKCDFMKLPQHEEELLLDKRRTKELTKKKQEMIAQLEQLVSLDAEREEMLEQYTAFEIEHRIMIDPNGFESHEAARVPARWDVKTPCERFLQHVSIVVDTRAWFASWRQLEEKWLDTPLVTLHGSLVLSRLKQFRRRLLFASTRLLPVSSSKPDDDFIVRDHQLVEDLERRVDQTASDCVILHAATCGFFTSERWATCRQLLGLQGVDFNCVTLRMIKKKSEVEPSAVLDFKKQCEVVLVEAKLLNTAERVRQRLSRCQVLVKNSNFRVVFVSMQGIVLELDDMQMEARRLVQAPNPGLDVAVNLLQEIQLNLQLCDRLLSFQAIWEELCQLIRVHDIDEFFTGQVAWKGPVQRQKKKVGRDESIWAGYVEVAQAWSDRLRRLVCMSQSEISSKPPVQAGLKGQGDSSQPSDVLCALHDVLEAFEGFDFDASTTKCELANQLVDRYLSTLREKCPRLYQLSKHQLLELLVNDDDLMTIRNTLSRCYPRVAAFIITRGRKQEVRLLQENGLTFSKTDTSDSAGSVVIKGIQSGGTERDFNVPVVKVGRLRFWLTRLDEEMSSVVLDNTKQAVTNCLALNRSPREPIGDWYEALYPQSIAAALCHQFTSAMRTAIGWTETNDERPVMYGADIEAASARVKEERESLLAEAIAVASSVGSRRNDARLDSMILLLHYQIEVASSVHTAFTTKTPDEAKLIWDSQFKVDFVVDDTSTKTVQRVHQCDYKTWVEIGALGPSYPVTFIGNIGRSDFIVGKELVGTHRIPVITPLTQRCIFEIFKALRCRPLSLIAPMSEKGRGGHKSFIHGVALMLMNPLLEVSCSSSASVDLLKIANLLSAVVALGSFLAIHNLEMCDTQVVRTLAEKMKQLRQDVHCGLVTIGSSLPEHRSPAMPSPTACIFAPIKRSDTESKAVRQLLLHSSEAFHPVTIMLPTIAHFTRIMALLAGYTLEEFSTLQPVVMFFELLIPFCGEQRRCSPTTVYRLIMKVMEDISRVRYTSRVLLPSNAKVPPQFSRGARRGGRRISTLFRRSADAQDVSDVVIHTIFSHILRSRHNTLLTEICSTSDDEGRFDQTSKLLDQCFPSAKGCELVDKTARSTDETIWDAMEMSLSHAGLIAHTTLIEKAVELASILQSCGTIIVTGNSGVGKTTCIKTLHNALQALEMTETEDDDGKREETQFRSTSAQATRETSRLIFVSPRFFFRRHHAHDQRSKHILEAAELPSAPGSDALRNWLCVDGALESSQFESFLLRGGAHEEVARSGSGLQRNHPHTIFETSHLASASPAVLVVTRVLHVPQMLTQDDLLANWRANSSKKLPFPEDSRGAQNVALIFRLTEHFIRGPVRQFIATEESNHATPMGGLALAPNSAETPPTHFGFLSVQHLTLSCFHLIAGACFRHRSLLDERSSSQIARLVLFCISWGFAGHLSELYRQKLDQLLRQEIKQFSEFKQLSDGQEDLYDSESLGASFWESIQLPLRGVPPAQLRVKDQSKSHAKRLVYDSHATGNQILVLSQAATPLVRVLRLLIQSHQSFVVVGPRGSGKSSILRMLWLMNLEDQAAEVMVDASLDHRFAPDILNWQLKPRKWYEPPETLPSDTTQYRGRARDEALFFASFSAGAAKWVFVEDLALSNNETSQTQNGAIDEFVRVVIDHKLAVNWTTQTIMPVAKAFGATMTRRELALPRQRAAGHVERLLRHFSVFNVPSHDRQQLQSIFRQVYVQYFETTESASSRTNPSSERNLTLPEIVVRACVDLATDTLTVQQTSERLQLVDGFSFNLHHLNAELSRTLAFCGMVSASQHGAQGADSGANLLSLGKLHQCWVSVLRQDFLLACSLRAPPSPIPAEDPSFAVVAVDEVKKIVQSMKMTSEKYFSVPVRDEPYKALVTDIVYGTYRYLTSQPQLSSSDRASLEELLTSNASASTFNGARRKQSAIDGGASQNDKGGAVMAREEFAVSAARDMLLSVASEFVSDSSSTSSFDAATRLTLRLHLSSSVGLHQLLHTLQAVTQSPNVLMDEGLGPIHEDVVRLAFAMERFEIVEASDAISLVALIDSALLAATTGEKKIALWIRLDQLEGELSIRAATDLLIATSLGKAPARVFDHHPLLEEVVRSCVQHQNTLQVLSDEDIYAHFKKQIRQYLRLVVISGTSAVSSSLSWLLELMRGSGSFQWISFAVESDKSRYQHEVAQRTIQEIDGLPTSSVVSRLTIDEDSEDDSQTVVLDLLRVAWDEGFGAQKWEEHTFLSFSVNLIVDYKRRKEEVMKRVGERQRLVQALHQVKARIPLLTQTLQSLADRFEQLGSWHDELLHPFQDLKHQHRELAQHLHEKEAELAADEVRSLQRKLQKLELQIWSHRAMVDEYDMGRSEVVCRKRELEEEMRQWQKYASVRESTEHRFTQQLNQLRSCQDPQWQMRRSIRSVCCMFSQKDVARKGGEGDGQNDTTAHPADETEHEIRRLWRARFPFLTGGSDGVDGDAILWAIDGIHDRVPLIVDKCGLFQHVLVQLFSNLPLFADANDEHERRENVGFTPSGAVAPCIVQCDDSDKMWRRIREAEQKQTPVLLVGVSARQIPSLATFVRRHTTNHRSNLLAELTLEAYRHQLKRDETQHHKNGSSRASNIVMSVLGSAASLPSGAEVKKAKRLPNLLSKAGVGAVQGSSRGETSSSRRGSVVDASSLTRRASLILAEGARQAVVAPPRGLGFQIYAVTQHSIDAEIVLQTGGFLLREAGWATANIEQFFMESWIRRFDKKLSKDLVDSRQAEVYSAQCVKLAEEAVWPAVQSPAWISPDGREPFMHKLTSLHEEDERYRMQTSRLEARAIALSKRRQDTSGIARYIALVARSATTFAGIVTPQSGAYFHSYRFFEQIVEHAAATLLKHAKDTAHTEGNPSHVPNAIAKHVLEAVVPALASRSHQLIFLMLVAIQRLRLDGLKAQDAQGSFQWLLHGGLAQWSHPSEGRKKKKPASHAADVATELSTDTSSNELPTDGSIVAPSTAAGPGGASLVERLRRKVRVCALLFDQLGVSAEQEGKRTRREDEDPGSASLFTGSDTIQSLQGPQRHHELEPASLSTQHVQVDRLYRSIARAAKSLWCEWKLAKETQRSDVRLAIVSMPSTLLTISRVGIPVGMKRKHHSVKDMTLASSTVTQVLNLNDVVTQHLGLDTAADSGACGTLNSSLGERLAVVMITKVYFPQQLEREWVACISKEDDLTQGLLSRGTSRSTSQVLGIESHARRGLSDDAQTEAVTLDQPLQLPPSIDVAWRRDDLVHLPSRVLLYEATRERVTLEVLLLRTKTSGPPGGSLLRVFSVLALDEYEQRLREQVLASVTSKERFAIEISSECQFDPVLALVSQVINQHALLCIPEWYVICDVDLFTRLQSPSMCFLHVHVIMKGAESVSLQLHLSQWLTHNAGLSEDDATVASRGLLMLADCGNGEQRNISSTAYRPLAAVAEAFVANCKTILQTGDAASRQQRLKDFIDKRFKTAATSTREQDWTETRDPAVQQTYESVDVLSDLMLLPLPASSPQRTTVENTKDNAALPEALLALVPQLEKLCETLSLPTTAVASGDDSSVPGTALWISSLVEDGSASAIALALAFVSLLEECKSQATETPSRQRRALIQNGIVPMEWLASHLPMLSDACLSNVVSVAQVLVLVVSRLGFLIHARSSERLEALPLSLINDVQHLLTTIQQNYSSAMRMDAVDVQVVLEATAPLKEEGDAKPNDPRTVVVPEKRARKNSLGLQRRSQAQETQREANRAAVAHAAPSWVIVSDERGVPCGVQVEGLVAVERIASSKTGKTQIFIHELPPCRLVCRPRQSLVTQRTSRDRDALASAASSSRLPASESPIVTALKQEGVPLTTIVSTSAFQTLPDSFWQPTTSRIPPILERVVFAPSLLLAVPSLSRSRSDQDAASVVLAVPMFSSEDDDAD